MITNNSNIDSLLSAMSDGNLRNFVKSYSMSNLSFMESLEEYSKRIAKKHATFDYEKAVKQCFNHYYKAPVCEHGGGTIHNIWEGDEISTDDKRSTTKICERLQQFYKSEILDFIEYDIDNLIEGTRSSLLTEDEFLEMKLREFNAEQGWRK